MDRSRRPSLGFIGAGVVGSSLAQELSGAGYAVTAVCSRDRGRAEALVRTLGGARAVISPQDVVNAADIVFLTVPDDAIAPVAAAVRWQKGRSAVHCNGAASLDLLRPATNAGAEAGVLHPLQSFASVDQAKRWMRGSTFRIEASTDALRGQLEAMAVALGGRPLVLNADPALYHISAVLASNYVVTLLSLASDLWSAYGATREEALQALLPLVRGTIENIERLGIPAALTGPIARGDAGTVAHHLDVLRKVAPHVLPVYKELALRALEVALAKGSIDRDQVRRLESVLSDAGRGGAPCE